MKSIIRLSFIMTVILFASCSSSKSTAQDTIVDPETEAIKQTVKLESQLNLNPDQFNKVKEINIDYLKEAQKNRSDSNQDRSFQQTLMKKNKEDRNIEMKQVLTDAQYKKYISLESGKGGRTRDGSRSKGSGGRSRN